MAVHGDRWKLEDAKARFSEVVRVAKTRGPQKVSVRGKDSAVILSIEDYERLKASPKRLQLIAFMESLQLSDLDLERPNDLGRDIDF